MSKKQVLLGFAAIVAIGTMLMIAQRGSFAPKDVADRIAHLYMDKKFTSYVLDRQHPDMRSLYMDLMEAGEDQYNAAVRLLHAGRRFAIHVSEIRPVHENSVYGETPTWKWALVPIAVRSTSKGKVEFTNSCFVWLIFWQSEEYYIENLADPVAVALFETTLPEFEGLLVDEMPECG